MSESRERVHTVTDYWDGPRAGVADFGGHPHAFRRVFDGDEDDWTEIFLLKPLSVGQFEVVMQDWAIWLRWRAAYDAGKTTLDTHPALPEDAEAHARLADAVADAMNVPDDGPFAMAGEFTKDSVVWTTPKRER